MSSNSTAVSVSSLAKRFKETVALHEVSLEVRTGEFVSLLGPSGCGKTTLLRIIAGLESADSGAVTVGGNDVTRIPPHRRPVNLVFQRYALFPHMTVAANVGFGLKLAGVRGREREARVAEALELVHLGGYGSRSVEKLSGGQAQRVALARALITEPTVLLLDEPLAALDLKLRQAMHIELRDIQKRVGTTFVYVTHDQQEALVMSDRIVLMNEGRIVQDGPPEQIYRSPTSLFASRFIGEANILRTGGTGSTRRVADTPVVIQGQDTSAAASEWVSIRPESIYIEPSNGAAEARANHAVGEVSRRIFMGSVFRFSVRVGDQELLVERPASDPASADIAAGAPALVWWDAAAVVALPEGR